MRQAKPITYTRWMRARPRSIAGHRWAPTTLISAPDVTEVVWILSDNKKRRLMVGEHHFVARVVLSRTPYHTLLREIYVRPDQRGLGLGAAVLASVVRGFGSIGRMELHVQPDADSPLSGKQLVDWYKRYGFVEASHVWNWMVREPGPLNWSVHHGIEEDNNAT